MMRTAGVIGGFGPETTAEFYMRVIKECQKQQPTTQPPILIKSPAVPYELHERLIVDTDLTALEDMKPYLLDTARWLERGGADFIVIPCNTLHALIDDIKKSVKIPVLSIIDETVARVSSKEVGLLATTLTRQQELYQQAFNKKGVVVVLPHNEDQKKTDQIINRLVRNEHLDEDREELVSCIHRQGTKQILLACTDLQLLIPNVEGIEILDTMQLLAEATVREIIS